MSYQRIETLNYLIHRINSFAEGYRQNIAIIGEPYIGKTLLIKSLLSSDQINIDHIIPIYLEIKVEPFEFCAKRFIKSALFQLLNLGPSLMTLQDNLLLIEDIARTFPKTAQTCNRVLQDIERNRFDDAYSFMFDIPASISEETKKRCILILDEFNNIDNFSLKHPFGALAKKIMIQKDTMYVLVSSRNTVSQKILDEKLSLLFGNFEKIFVPPFDSNMSRSFIQDNIKSTSLPHIYLDFISAFCGNRPLYIRLICEEIERLVLSKKAAPDDYQKLTESSLAETIFKKTGSINQLFLNLFLNISDCKLLSKTAAVLIALSSGSKKQNDIARQARLQTREASKILARLTETDTIVRNGSFYRCRDRLFSFWLESVYLQRISSFSIDEALEETRFRKDIMNRLDMFLQEFEKELSSRVTELFKLFKNDVIQLNGKKHKFFSFNNVHLVEESPAKDTTILATGGRVKWLCTVRKDYVTENEILEVIKSAKARKKENKINRNVLISLAGINENAYLMAKEAKFWVWGLDDLNVLMELYGKPNIT